VPTTLTMTAFSNVPQATALPAANFGCCADFLTVILPSVSGMLVKGTRYSDKWGVARRIGFFNAEKTDLQSQTPVLCG
jgi:hypothetical protein